MGTEMNFDCATAYYDEARRSLRGHKRLAEGAFVQLSDDEFFRVIDPEANSVALIVKHMTGNMRSRFTDFLTTDGEKPDRNRDTEFEMNEGTTALRSWNGGNAAGKSSSARSTALLRQISAVPSRSAANRIPFSRPSIARSHTTPTTPDRSSSSPST